MPESLDVRHSIKKKKKALHIFQKSDKLDNYIALKKLRAKTRYLVKSSTTKLWKTFTSNIGSRIDHKQVWRLLKSSRN